MVPEAEAAGIGMAAAARSAGARVVGPRAACRVRAGRRRLRAGMFEWSRAARGTEAGRGTAVSRHCLHYSHPSQQRQSRRQRCKRRLPRLLLHSQVPSLLWTCSSRLLRPLPSHNSSLRLPRSWHLSPLQSLSWHLWPSMPCNSPPRPCSRHQCHNLSPLPPCSRPPCRKCRRPRHKRRPPPPRSRLPPRRPPLPLSCSPRCCSVHSRRSSRCLRTRCRRPASSSRQAGPTPLPPWPP